VGSIVVTGGTAAVNGIAMLNPQRWGGQGTRPVDTSGTMTAAEAGYQAPDFGDDNTGVLFQSGVAARNDVTAELSASIPMAQNTSLAKPEISKNFREHPIVRCLIFSNITQTLQCVYSSDFQHT
jgi:hypothetical protein